MIRPDLLSELTRIVGPDHVSVGRADVGVYSYDASLAAGVPDAVVFPADTEQTAAVVRAAVKARVPYVPRGFGTNLSGGSVARGGGVVLGLSRLNRILDIRPEGRYAVVQPGVTNQELQDALVPLGCFYAPDPASQKVATLGGNVGENSGGPHCLKYGVTGNHILGMTWILPGGEAVRIGGPALDPPGYDLRGVLIGSEGTLGIVTELFVRILPRPESVETLLVVYDDIADAARSVSDIVAAGIVPATLEMMDATIMHAVEESMPCGYPLDAAAVLIAEVDGPLAGLAQQAERISAICGQNGCREVRKAKDAAERDLLWAGRRGAFGAIARLSPNYHVADCTVPRTKLPEALERVGAIAEKHQLAHGNVFHAGDGNLHPLLLFDARDADQVERVHAAATETMEACVALGGTITGEHGVGIEKADAMRMVFSEADLDFQRALRVTFDPEDLINPGKILPPDIHIDEPAVRRTGYPARPGRTGLSGLRTTRREPAGQGISDAPELTPTNVEEACDMVRCAAGAPGALLPLGNGTHRDFGNYSEPAATPLRSTGLSAVVEYDAANQTITIGAGMSLKTLQGVLGGHNQWLPLRPPGGGERTAGGVAALGSCGPERLRYGAPRDLLLGMKFVSGLGRPISAGGRVVKNVAGYDVTRLVAGSAGTLGFITELTLRVASLPERCLALVAAGTLERCGAAATELLQSKLEPAFVFATPQGPDIKFSGDGMWTLSVGFEGFGETVDAQLKGCGALLERSGLRAEGQSEYSALEGLCDRPYDLLASSAFLLRADVSPDSVVEFVHAQQGILSGAGTVVDFGCGRVLVGMSSLTDDGWTRSCENAMNAKGHAILEKAPEDFKRQHDVFGPARPCQNVMHRIKAALDPRSVFAPGRLPGRK